MKEIKPNPTFIFLFFYKNQPGTKVYRSLASNMVAKFPPGGASDVCLPCGLRRRLIPSLITSRLLHYCASNPAITMLTAQSEGIIHIELDAFSLATQSKLPRCNTFLPQRQDDSAIKQRINGNIHTHRQTLKEALSSAAESELGFCCSTMVSTCDGTGSVIVLHKAKFRIVWQTGRHNLAVVDTHAPSSESTAEAQRGCVGLPGRPGHSLDPERTAPSLDDDGCT
jgi:hypothetical protein